MCRCHVKIQAYSHNIEDQFKKSFKYKVVEFFLYDMLYARINFSYKLFHC